MSDLIKASAKAVSQEPGMPTTQDQRGWTKPHQPRLRMIAYVDNDNSNGK